MRTPAASNTSALPDLPVAARLPCFATVIPAAAATNAAAVETLKSPAASPPVPTVSTTLSDLTDTAAANSRITIAAAVNSSTVSPLICSAVRNAPICAGVASPCITIRMTLFICSRSRSALLATERIALCISMIKRLRNTGQGISTVAPVVRRASRSRWASAASDRGRSWCTSARTVPSCITSNNSDTQARRLLRSGI